MKCLGSDMLRSCLVAPSCSRMLARKLSSAWRRSSMSAGWSSMISMTQKVCKRWLSHSSAGELLALYTLALIPGLCLWSVSIAGCRVPERIRSRWCTETADSVCQRRAWKERVDGIADCVSYEGVSNRWCSVCLNSCCCGAFCFVVTTYSQLWSMVPLCDVIKQDGLIGTK